MSANFKLSCVLFDLDGTLVDTAPDLIACLNKALRQYGLDEVRSEQLKPFISDGAIAMIKQSVNNIEQQTQDQILQTMLELYQDNIAEHSRFFPGIPETLDIIETLGLKWGIVTNKRQCFTHALVTALKLTHRAACVISGDSTAHCKPHPEPMLAACTQADVSAEECVYIGDAWHDINAGNGVNMKTLVALYGYLKTDDKPGTWGADALIESPEQLSLWISKACH